MQWALLALLSLALFLAAKRWKRAVCATLVVLAFAYSDRIGSWIGSTGMRAISKIISLLLAAIAVNMVRRGFE